MEKMKCEFCCGEEARLYCEEDEASLCWDCDGNVHGGNFLGARHTRCLLCSVCQSHTSWKVSGLRLGQTVSTCESCLARRKSSFPGRNQNLNQDIIGCDHCAEPYAWDEDEAENQIVTAAVAVVGSSSSVSSDRDLVTQLDLDLNSSAV